VRVAVTGADGFLGRWVCGELDKRGHSVKHVVHHDVDLLDFDDARDACEGQTAVVHLAARVGGIGMNVEQPGRLYYQNAQMGLNVLEAARLEHVLKVVVIGTACEYPEHAPMPLKEDYLWDGYPAPATAAYALAKKGLLEMGQAYKLEYGMEIEHVIPTNLYGPGDNFDPKTGHVIPGIITKFSAAQERGDDQVALWGSGTPTRDFLHVADAARGIADAVETEMHGLPVNLGSGVETKISDVAFMVGKLYNIEHVVWDEGRPDGTQRRILDTYRAKHLLGWSPTVPLGRGLYDTVAWFEDWD
jgi:nucleoside-diphosphate-sugar epimerase